MTSKSMHILIVFYVFGLVGCGLYERDINIEISVPKNLKFVHDAKTKHSIEFKAFNPELKFLGYNVYHANDKYEIRAAHRKHVVDQKIDEKIRNARIISDRNGQYPTISVYSLELPVTSSEQTIKYKLEKSPNGRLSDDYCVAVSAILGFKNLESDLSNTICTTDAHLNDR